MAIIKLTQKDLDIESAFDGREDCYKNLETFVNTKNIISFTKSEEGSSVYLVTGELQVQETPEEILALINGEVGLDDKPCKDFMGFDRKWIAKEAKDKGVTFKECLFLLYFFNNVSITPQDRSFKAGVEMYKKFAKATVKALGLIKEAEK